MTGATRDALELIRSLKKQYPDETDDQLVSSSGEVFNDLLQELEEGKPPD